MSRVAKNPVPLPKGVTATIDGETVTVKGAKGTLSLPVRRGLSLVQEGQTVNAGQQLGHAGYARGWHVHFMVNSGNTTMGIGDRNPMPFVDYARKHA